MFKHVRFETQKYQMNLVALKKRQFNKLYHNFGERKAKDYGTCPSLVTKEEK